MALDSPFQVYDHDVYVLTRKGKEELQDSETSLSPAEIELLVRIDGLATVETIRTATRMLAQDDIVKKFVELARAGLIDLASNEKTQSLDFINFFDEKSRKPPAKANSQDRSEAATGLTTLHKNGYFVRIARRRATRKRPTRGETLTVLVVEDDFSLANFLRKYLELERFNTRVATNREEIVAELRRPPLPDLVLLDVMLPDTDGFYVLQKMREHAVFKSVPVLMLTAKATRAAVLKGLTGGADGYVTKPFEVDALIRAVKTVLGLPKNPFEKRSKDPWSSAD